ncbi:hypothetical protein AYO21_10723 [Fonsecaea monophora]|uniref:FAD/NAD(P)-binding domain-containing protein n=1 Tax=Fonsecaea monophora TaxID=254056 RepID=A0A177ET34_9EURO|nr:hypothetical protein AYO21_10723 [Fonsecaea monophora]KAH0831714.1 hypothetical protein FOPE_02853 [Fonsecaea pedrosoi]OAG35108.1 hypothetical protein AYO21_10723 [Fonsecaea monophora]
MSRGVPKKVFDAVVVGAGGAGVATVGALLHFNQTFRIGWVDPDFSGGRISKKYRDVSSNTKTSLFRQYADAFEPFRQIVASTPKPHAVTVLEALDQNRGCRLQYAADMLTMLTTGLRRHANVETHMGTLSRGDFQTSSASWSMDLDPTTRGPTQKIFSRNVIMCTGSSPTTIPLPCSSPTILDLDVVLDRQALRASLPMTGAGPVVGVIGTSHSAIVAIMNLYELATSTHPHLHIKWFVRSPMTYAVEMDGWILRDNTGLKGASADFARAHLEDDKLPGSPVGEFLTKVDCPDVRDASMIPHLDSCTHVVEAIGYTRDPLPRLSVDGTALEGIISYDPTNGALLDGNGHVVPHAYGAGIAFPERVTDPAGNTESAVGLWKFIKYLNRVVPTWC